MNGYYDPWAKTGQSIADATFKVLASRPNAEDQALRQLEAQKMRSEIEKSAASVQAANALANERNLKAKMLEGRMGAAQNLGSIFGDIYNQPYAPEAPSEEFVGPMPQMPASELPADIVNQRYRENLPNLFQNAMQFSADSPSNLGDVFLAFAANSGATPDQISNAQLGAGQSYDDTRDAVMNAPYTLSPGSGRFDSSNNQVAFMPSKDAVGGFDISLPDGTRISQGQPFGTSANNTLDKQIISLDGALQSIDQTLGALESESGALWKSTGIPGAIGGSNTLGMVRQIPGAEEAFDALQLTEGDATRIKTNRALMQQTINEVGRFIVNGPYSDRFSNDDRKAANEAITIAQAGTDDASAKAILQSLRQTLESRLGGVRDLQMGGTAAAGQNRSRLNVNTTNEVGVKKWGRDEQGKPVALGN